MNRAEIIHIILTSLPAYSALICGLLVLRLNNRRESTLGQRPLLLTFAAYLLWAVAWLALIFYVALPEVYLALSPLVALCYSGAYVVSYRFVFEVTKTDTKEKFPGLHYILPVAGFVFMLGCLLFDRQFSEVLKALPLWMLLFNLTYAILGLIRAKRYRRTVVNYSADVQRASLRWLYHILYSMLAIVPLTGTLCFLSGTDLVNYRGLVVVAVLAAVFKYTILVHNLLMENFVIIQLDNGNSEKGVPESFSMEADALRQKALKLDAYMRKYKPYLNPRLKITDITVPLSTNRTALSLLINSSMGMNFSRYVNRYRLLEFERLKSDPAGRELSEAELATKAGFSEYRGYLRVKQREEITI